MLMLFVRKHVSRGVALSKNQAFGSRARFALNLVLFSYSLGFLTVKIIGEFNPFQPLAYCNKMALRLSALETSKQLRSRVAMAL